MFKKLLLFFVLFTGSIFGKLNVPPVQEGLPMPGKRVKVHLTQDVYYTLYLPHDYDSFKRWPVLFESPCNATGTKPTDYSGLPDDAYMSYGLSLGHGYIWVGAPYIDETGKQISVFWWGGFLKNTIGIENTVKYWLEILKDLNHRFPIDNEAIILGGFSRGAIGALHIGNWNNEISQKWCAYFTHDHFDSDSYGAGYSIRVSRIRKKKILMTGGQNSYASYVYQAYLDLIKYSIDATYMMIPNQGHTMDWILEDYSPEASAARYWLNNL